jgi:hypothetical protein
VRTLIVGFFSNVDRTLDLFGSCVTRIQDTMSEVNEKLEPLADLARIAPQLTKNIADLTGLVSALRDSLNQVHVHATSDYNKLSERVAILEKRPHV